MLLLAAPLILSAPLDTTERQSTYLYDLGITIEPARESAPLQGIGVANPNLVRIQNQIDSLSLAFSNLQKQFARLNTEYAALESTVTELRNRTYSPYLAPSSERISYKRAEGETFMKKGKDAYNARNYPVAIEYFQKVVASDMPRVVHGEAYYWIGDCYLQLKDEYLALEYFKRLAEYPLSDKVPDAFYLSGLIYRRLGVDHLAQDFFQRLIKRFPESKYAKLAELELQRMNHPEDQ